jgi:hypothetical protein
MGPGANDHDAARMEVKDDEDRDTFVRTQGEGCARGGFRVHAWVLMRNHLSRWDGLAAKFVRPADQHDGIGPAVASWVVPRDR